MAQTARPDADGTITGWTDQAGGTTNLYATLDETTPSDADYVMSADNPTAAQRLRLRLSNVTDPVSSSGHSLNVRMQKSLSGGSTVTAELRIYQGGSTTLGAGTLIATFDGTDNSAMDNVPNGWTAYSFTLSAGETDAITDYTDLWVEIEADQV